MFIGRPPTVVSVHVFLVHVLENISKEPLQADSHYVYQFFGHGGVQLIAGLPPVSSILHDQQIFVAKGRVVNIRVESAGRVPASVSTPRSPILFKDVDRRVHVGVKEIVIVVRLTVRRRVAQEALQAVGSLAHFLSLLVKVTWQYFLTCRFVVAPDNRMAVFAYCVEIGGNALGNEL